MSKKSERVIWIVVTAIYGIIAVYMLFHNLGEGYLIQTDEAYHATNAYEMFKQGNWIVNTYRYAADYFNSKPPLCLDLMVMSYKAMGVSGFAARFPSAVGGLITYILLVLFFLYMKDVYSAVIFPPLFLACSELFTFHMYRAAEMDSIFNLFFVVAMLSLQRMREKYFFMYIYGLALGLAFMCKGPHAAIIFIIGLLYIPVIKEAFKSIGRVIGAIITAAIIPVCWMIKRYQFDGLKLFDALFMGEVVERVSDADQTAGMPIADFITSNIAVIFAATVVTMIIMMGVYKFLKKDAWIIIKEFLIENYLYILWVIVPVAFFSITRSYLTWYTYTSQIALCVLTARLASACIRRIGHEKAAAKITVTVLTVGMSLWFIIPCVIYDINLAGTGGHPVDKFTGDMREFYDEYKNQYSGVNTYLIAEWSVSQANDGHWEPEYVAPAEMYCDLLPVDGTIDYFLNDPDSILILDKSLWDEYSSVLTGHVILHDNSYLIFSNDMY